MKIACNWWGKQNAREIDRQMKMEGVNHWSGWKMKSFANEHQLACSSLPVFLSLLRSLTHTQSLRAYSRQMQDNLWNYSSYVYIHSCCAWRRRGLLWWTQHQIMSMKGSFDPDKRWDRVATQVKLLRVLSHASQKVVISFKYIFPGTGIFNVLHSFHNRNTEFIRMKFTSAKPTIVKQTRQELRQNACFQRVSIPNSGICLEPSVWSTPFWSLTDTDTEVLRVILSLSIRMPE